MSTPQLPSALAEVVADPLSNDMNAAAEGMHNGFRTTV